MNRTDDVVSIAVYETATFICTAVSDDSSVITYRWYYAEHLQPLVIDNRTYHVDGRRLTVDTQFDDDGGLGRAGTYRCVADNGYSSDVATFQLDVDHSRLTFHIHTFSL